MFFGVWLFMWLLFIFHLKGLVCFGLWVGIAGVVNAGYLGL